MYNNNKLKLVVVVVAVVILTFEVITLAAFC